jgi:ankyrin repeat protein
MGNAIGGGSGQHGAFLAAARAGDADYVVEALGQGLRLLLCAQTWKGRTLFHEAAQSGQNELLAAVVETVAGSDPCCRQEKVFAKHGNSPQGVVRALANDRDSKGCTPLHVAATHGQEETIKYLLQLGADPWVKVRPQAAPGSCCAAAFGDRQHSACSSVSVAATGASQQLVSPWSRSFACGVGWGGVGGVRGHPAQVAPAQPAVQTSPTTAHQGRPPGASPNRTAPQPPTE